MFTVVLEILHDALGFFMRSTVAFIVMACLVCHHHNTLLEQPIKALLQCGVHIGNSGGEPLGIETETVYRHFPVFGELVLLAFSDIFHVHKI